MTDTVVVLPGLGSPGWSMAFLASRLRQRGFGVTVTPYRASWHSLSEVVADVTASVEECAPSERIHFLGHSMGGLVARGIAEAGLRNHAIGRIVMVGTPLLGSGIAARLAALPLGWLPYGRLWPDLSPRGCVDNGLALPGVEIGMIAGAVPGGSLFRSGGTDGIVPVDATRAAGLKDHVTVPASHALLLLSDIVATSSARFFETGSFVTA